ncbi:5267_t:CDS:1 [Ambispora gerdemannii]|uniref:5267_t:CDS:1 n=1 Tax=Ambispora gerdemannii TaxID=144530 RepID=A0A9N8V8Q0_9GLOM|nr:5267_t:CDS:1 [Ambispora gerdemannii]
MPRLPLELWKQIVDSFSDHSNLRSLLLVNKVFNEFAACKLYNRVIIGPGCNFDKFANTILNLTDGGNNTKNTFLNYASLVHTITIITSCELYEFPWYRLPLVLAECENADGLLISPREQYAERSTIAVLEVMRSFTLVTKYLAKAIEIMSARKIRRLCLRSLRFVSEFQRHGTCFVASLSLLRDLKSIELWHENGRPLGSEGKHCIVDLITQNNLNDLHLDSFVIDELEFENVVRIFESSYDLESLTWGGTKFSLEEEEFLYRSIFQQNCPKLTNLTIEVSGFHEGEDFLLLSKYSQGLKQLHTLQDLDGGALPLSTFMNFVTMNKSTLKKIDAWVSLAPPPFQIRRRRGFRNPAVVNVINIRTNNNHDSDFESSESDEDVNDDYFDQLHSFYHPVNTHSYAEWIQSLIEKFQETNRAWNDHYDVSISLSHPRLASLLHSCKESIEQNWQSLVDEHLGNPIREVCQHNLNELKLFLTYW